MLTHRRGTLAHLEHGELRVETDEPSLSTLQSLHQRVNAREPSKRLCGVASDEVAICILNGHHIASGNCTRDLCGPGLLTSSLCTGCCSCSDVTKQAGAEGSQGLSYHWPDHGVPPSPPFAACQYAPPDPLSHQSDWGHRWMDSSFPSVSKQGQRWI